MSYLSPVINQLKYRIMAAEAALIRKQKKLNEMKAALAKFQRINKSK